MIEFTPDGKILTANDNFLRAVSYDLDDIRGRHHSMFVEASYARSPDYAAFWKKLQAGELWRPNTGGSAKMARSSGSRHPTTDFRSQGRVIKVVKFATDVTSRVEAIDAIAEG
jgi:methyl-accepting chemotaxis protein